MTRLTHLRTSLALAGLLTGATIAACGGHPTSPGEMPPLAPRPEPVGPPAMPVLPSEQHGRVPSTSDAGSMSRGPVSMRKSQLYQPAAAGQPAPNQPTTIQDAGTSDAATVPLPPMPDGGLADSRMEPIVQRDAGRP